MKINSKSKQLEMDFTFENISNTNNHMSISRLNEIRMNSRKIFKNNYICIPLLFVLDKVFLLSYNFSIL